MCNVEASYSKTRGRNFLKMFSEVRYDVGRPILNFESDLGTHLEKIADYLFFFARVLSHLIKSHDIQTKPLD